MNSWFKRFNDNFLVINKLKLRHAIGFRYANENKNIKMKSKRITVIGALLGLMLSTSAFASGGAPARTLASEDMVELAVYNEISGFNMKDFNLQDETVAIDFSINAEGKVIIENVEGNSCLINSYVTQMLKDKEFPISENLKNTTHHIKVRYVVL